MDEGTVPKSRPDGPLERSCHMGQLRDRSLDLLLQAGRDRRNKHLVSDGMTFIDFDNCRNAVRGEIEAWIETLAELNTYTEVDPVRYRSARLRSRNRGNGVEN